MGPWYPIPDPLLRIAEERPGSLLLSAESSSGASRDGQRLPDVTRVFFEPEEILIAASVEDLPAVFAGVDEALARGRIAAGYIAYECGVFFEPAAAPASNPDQTPRAPIAWLGIYAQTYLFDHWTGDFAGAAPAAPDQSAANPHVSAREGRVECAHSIEEAGYAKKIGEIQERIAAGEIYQLNFTFPLSVQSTGSAGALFARLMRLQRPPYGAFLHTRPGQRILSFSPELFFRIEEMQAGETAMPAWRKIVTRPMKGTAHRGRTNAEDAEQAAWLAGDEKNRAENVMIADLLRNDLGRICAFGSVRATRLFEVERYPTLWQMTSTVEGRLRPETGIRQIFRALFPSGSVTGAPKVRAMQLIGELEGGPRGVYTGAIGFFSRRETVFNVPIRTIEIEGEEGVFGVGSGIVSDSEAASEWAECGLKASFLSGPEAEEFEVVESLLWRWGYPMLEAHLARLADSARYFGFSCEVAAARSALVDHGAGLAGREPRKVRLQLSREGVIRVSSETISEATIGREAKPLRVCLWRERTDPSDPFYFHKTTHRPLYARAFNAAQAAGFEDVLFANKRGELTESARSNLFLVLDGMLLTPPVSCGLLGGVERARILATRAEASEAVLTLDDLRRGELFLSNAVRGLRRCLLVLE
jgi:para-aminobenzoate synthetase/4-amino-4-deoxychorismate lyase